MQNFAINGKILSTEEKDAFVAGWKEAGGIMDEKLTGVPWRCPWLWWDSELEIPGAAPEEWGANWWKMIKNTNIKRLEENPPVGKGFRLNGQTLTEEEEKRFISGWEAAGGYAGDCIDGIECPFCAPWNYETSLSLPGDTPEEWGAAYWEQCRPEVEQLLSKETASQC